MVIMCNADGTLSLKYLSANIIAWYVHSLEKKLKSLVWWRSVLRWEALMFLTVNIFFILKLIKSYTKDIYKVMKDFNLK